MLTGQSGAIDPVLVRLLDAGRFEHACAHLFEGYSKRGIEPALSRLLTRDGYRTP